MRCFSDEEFGELQEFSERAVEAAARSEWRSVFSTAELAEASETAERVVSTFLQSERVWDLLKAEATGAVFTDNELLEIDEMVARVTAELAEAADVLGDIGDLLG